MESSKINLEKITQIPENEFKEHFREWMEQDDVARCLQAKLRKDLILNFNKTTLGKKLIAQSAASHRLKLSPLVLAVNTLVAEFLYAQNCHFTLSVFCTEVPYRNILPDFEGVRHFRFSKVELFEIFEALSSNWTQTAAKDEIYEQYSDKASSSLLFVVLRYLLQAPSEKEPKVIEPTEPLAKDEQKQEKKNHHEDFHLRYLNKFLKIFLKKIKEMSANLGALQAQRLGTQSEKKSVNMRKLDNLNRSMHKMSENLRLMSVTKRKSRSINTIVSAINSMAKQFELCALGFHQGSKQTAAKSKESETGPAEKSYTDWIQEMRTTPNGQKFLEKIEQSLHKALLRERDKMEKEFDERQQVQKNILKAKYKHKLSEELAKFTAREKADAAQLVTDSLAKRLKEFELKSKEIHNATGPQTKTTPPVSRPPSCNKETQTLLPVRNEPLPIVAKEQRRVQDGVKVDNIVLDAKQRVQQLELESNALERNIREILEKQKSEKKLLNESTSSILSTYAVERSILEKKCAAFRPSIVPTEVVPPAIPSNRSAPDLSINPNLEEPIVLPTFKNAFREACQQLLARPQAGKGFKMNAVPQYYSSVLELMDKEKDARDSSPSPPCGGTSKVTVVPFKIKAATESVSLTTVMGGTANRSEEHWVEGQVFEMRDNGIPAESNGQQMNSNHYEQAESSMKQINNVSGDGGDAKEPTAHNEKDVGMNATVPAEGGGKK